jgi:hypothetical protein
MMNLNDPDLGKVRDHFFMGVQLHRRIRQFFQVVDRHEYVRLALGKTDSAGNYSAS